MSGLEILGLILGAMPILISALEGYQKLGKKRDAFRRKSMHIDRMIRALDWQQKLIRSDVRLVLRNAGLDVNDDVGDEEEEAGGGKGEKEKEKDEEKETEKEKMRDEPQQRQQQHVGVGAGAGAGHYQDLLNRPDIQKAVRAFLGDNSSAYLEVLQQCESAILLIAKAIKGFEAGSWVAKGSLIALVNAKQQAQAQAHMEKPLGPTTSDFFKKLKFSMHKDEIETSIKEIDDLSRLLERLREKSHQEHYHQTMILSSSASSSSKGAVTMLRKVQIRALRLYRALAQSWTRSCGRENAPHAARLYLDYRADRFEAASARRRKPFPASGKVEFSVRLQSCTTSAAGPPYQSCVVEALDLDEFEDEGDDKDRKVKVSFRTSTLDDAVATTTTTTTTTHKLNVDNMCHILDESLSTKQSLRLYLFANGRLCYEHVLSPETPGLRFTTPHVNPEKMVSLQNLLQDPAYRRLLQLKPRVKLAAIMASSALQLHATPWCRSLLRKESLLFMKDNESGRINLGHPFVACHFNNPNSVNNLNHHNESDSNYNDSNHPSVVVPSSSSSQAESELLDLGILILELWHHETMETFARDSGLALDDINIFDTRQRIARRWLTETKDDLLTSIYDAAVRCINCRFDAVDLDLTNHKLNIRIFDSVVKPLWGNCEA